MHADSFQVATSVAGWSCILTSANGNVVERKSEIRM